MLARQKMVFGNQKLAETPMNGILFVERKFWDRARLQPAVHIRHWKVSVNCLEVGKRETNVQPHLPLQVRQEQSGRDRIEVCHIISARLR